MKGPIYPDILITHVKYTEEGTTTYPDLFTILRKKCDDGKYYLFPIRSQYNGVGSEDMDRVLRAFAKDVYVVMLLGEPGHRSHLDEDQSPEIERLKKRYSQ